MGETDKSGRGCRCCCWKSHGTGRPGPVAMRRPQLGHGDQAQSSARLQRPRTAQPWALAFLTFTQRWAAVPPLALRSDRALSCCFLFLYHLPGCEAQCAATDRMRCQA
ncbi:hypothetical protein KOW79_008145 [Hemibagrus wyckioides]|uniref:Uncharacterized protein n=1 Tax=Hemibagrus wyckioides TaxID=337641 RepID=A0A9D3NTC4_9TELE|nr:hypothetical protein KOW79_008145 [Hemibagrus wyckioides]